MVALEHVERSAVGGGTVCHLAGEIDHSNSGEFAALVLRAYAAHGAPIVLDMSRVGFMDLAGLDVLLRARDRVAVSSPRALRLRRPSRQVERLLSVTGADDLLDPTPWS